jgi:type IV secretion system protein VirD4
MLTGLILHALHALPRERQHLAAINDMLLTIQDTLEAMAQSAHPRVRAIAEYLLSLPDRQFGGVHGSASAALILYDDPVVARNTGCSDFRISDLVCARYPMTCYLQVRPTDAVRLRPLTRLILTQVAQALMYDTGTAADGRAKQHRLLYLLEEFPSLGRLDFFSSQMRVMRGYGITALLIVQSFKDIINAYGRDQTIVDNCRIVICFAAADPDTQKMISTMLGSAVEKKESETRPRGWRGFGARPARRKPAGRCSTPARSAKSATTSSSSSSPAKSRSGRRRCSGSGIASSAASAPTCGAAAPRLGRTRRSWRWPAGSRNRLLLR